MTFLKRIIEELPSNKKKARDKACLLLPSYLIIKKEEKDDLIKNIDDINILLYINNNEVSYGVRDLINSWLKKNNDNEIIDDINNWDQDFINEVKNEYQTINYVTIMTVIIDRILAYYQKILDNYQKRRYNQSYYNSEIKKIQSQINYLYDIKKNDNIKEEINKLKKELHTKSKDKYDILYNNEVFIYIDSKCNMLLEKVNQKIIDINKKESKNDFNNIVLRFEDLEVSHHIITNYQYNKDINEIYDDFLMGINNTFHYSSNKIKCELVILYNGLNKVISPNYNDIINHINFRMKDLIEAVMVRKDEVNKLFPSKKKNKLVTEKISKIKEELHK